MSFIGNFHKEGSDEATLLLELGENRFTVRVTEGSVTRDYTLDLMVRIPSKHIVPTNSQPCFGASEEAMLKTLNVVPSPGSLISFTPEVDGLERKYTAVVSNNATHATVTAEGAHPTSRTFVQTGTWKPVLQPMRLQGSSYQGYASRTKVSILVYNEVGDRCYKSRYIFHILRQARSGKMAVPDLLTANVWEQAEQGSVAGNALTETETRLTPDFDGNGVIDFPDFLLFADVFGSKAGQVGYETKYDLDGDGEIGIYDFLIFANAFDEKTS